MVRVNVCLAVCLLLVNVLSLANAQKAMLIGEGRDFNLSCKLPSHVIQKPERRIQWTFAHSRSETEFDEPVVLSSWLTRANYTTQWESIPERYAARVKISSSTSGNSFDVQVEKATFSDHNGIYTCEGMDSRFTLIHSAKVIVTSPPILTVTETTMYGNTSDPIWLRLMVDSNPAPAVSCKHRDQQLIVKSARTEGSVQRSTMQPIVHKHKTIGRKHIVGLQWFLTADGDFGNYSCTAVNVVGTASINLTILPDRLPERPENVTAFVNEITTHISWHLPPYMDGLSQKAVVVLTTPDGQRSNPEAANDGNYIDISGIQTGTKITMNSQNMFGMMSDRVSYVVKFDTDSSNTTNMVLDDAITVQQSMNPSLRLALGLGVPLTVIAIIAMVVATGGIHSWPPIHKRPDDEANARRSTWWSARSGTTASDRQSRIHSQ
ncbi:hypothetical protein BV898_18031 [Hypsibius exemplaris]|uniref:Ig-like domain-containing protein n=1 Tax=Hypsibius exemplaris TaxID=2072580 RepID=A0A9X6NG36_HYPEX|nr:hypothetical protein BV898_18031 [Hypsibius exemplaris]